MKAKTNFIEEPASALKNIEATDMDIYEPDAKDIYEPDESDIDEPDDYDFLFKESLLCEAERIGDSLCGLYYWADRHAKAEENLIKMENTIVMSIGKDSYEDILDLIHYYKESIEREISDSLCISDSLRSQYITCE